MSSPSNILIMINIRDLHEIALNPPEINVQTMALVPDSAFSGDSHS
jgi:hypothetical protein